jgi:putative membrane protein
VRIFGILLTLLLVVVGAAFTALNAEVVVVNYLIGAKELSVAFVSLVSLLLGIVLGILVLGLSVLKLKAKNKWLESKLKRTQEQLTQVQH